MRGVGWDAHGGRLCAKLVFALVSTAMTFKTVMGNLVHYHLVPGQIQGQGATYHGP